MDRAIPAYQSIFRHYPERRKTLIWIAISIYALVAIIKKGLHLELSLSEILQILSITLFEHLLISEVLMN